jgi:two-component system response regulator FixJ
MRTGTKQHVFVVDDEPSVCWAVAKTLKRLGVEVTCFARATDCLEQLGIQTCDLLVTDVKMPEMDGITLLKEAKRIAPWLPVLVVTGYGDVPLAVEAMRVGAADFIEKPLHKETFLQKIEPMLRQGAFPDPYQGKPLTRTELKVLKMIVVGMSSKEIAHLFGRAVRTVEDQRSHIMRKFGVHNVIELVGRAIQMGLAELPPGKQQGDDQT